MKFFITIYMFSLSILCYAQQPKVIEFSEIPNDIIARTKERKDINGTPCGVVRVSIAMPDVAFDGWIIDKQNRPGEYIVYMADKSEKITILHPSCIPMEYKFPQPIESRHTYRLVLEMPQTNQTYIRLRSNVKKAQIDIEGQKYNTNDGVFTLTLPNGEYKYTATTPLKGFSIVEGKLDVSNQPYLEDSVRFASKASYVLNVNTDAKALITIDGEPQKKDQRQFILSAGIHTIEAMLGDGNVWTETKDVDMSEGNASVDLNMRGILRIVYPSNAQFEIRSLDNALPPSKKTFNTGDAISLLGDYEIVVNKKNYEKTRAKVSIGVGASIENFRIDVVSKGDNYFLGQNGERQNYEKAFKEYKKMADKGDDIAQFQLASCYENGYGTPVDYQAAMEYWKISSNNGNCDATYQLAQRTTSNDDERLRLYLLAAKQGNIPSMKIVGDYYVSIKDFENAKKYYLMAIKGNPFRTNNDIEKGIAGSLAGLGELYYQGNEVSLDRKKAYDYFAKAASRGSLLALERIADYIYYGFETGLPNQDEAIEKYKEIGEGLSAEGNLRVGIYEYEKQHYEIANQYFFRLANKDFELGDNIIDIFLRMGDVMYKTDKPASFFYYDKTAAQNVSNLKQFVRLGYMYLNGQGTEKKPEKSKEYFEKGAVLGDAESICMIGYLYEKGLGVKKDIEKAIEHYSKAGKMGYMKAYNNLGTVYAHTKNMEKAEFYWGLAAKAGNKTAINNLIKFYKNRNNTEKVDVWTSKLK